LLLLLAAAIAGMSALVILQVLAIPRGPQSIHDDQLAAEWSTAWLIAGAEDGQDLAVAWHLSRRVATEGPSTPSFSPDRPRPMPQPLPVARELDEEELFTA
jgi:hypothetical protein